MDSPSEPTDPDGDEPVTPASGPSPEPTSADEESTPAATNPKPRSRQKPTPPSDPATVPPEPSPEEAAGTTAAEPEPATSTIDPPEGNKTTSIRIGAVIAVALAAAFVVWLLVRNDDSSSNASTQTVSTVATTPTTTTPSNEANPPAATSETELQRLAAAGATVYWAGPAEAGTTLTLVKVPNGTFYVRYLPPGAEVTDPIPPSLVVATYPLEGALAAVKRAAKSPDSVSIPIANGGTAVYAKSKPTNVYFAYPKSSTQIEVYDPSPGRALQLVTSGSVTPVTP
jgi:hypothetical protein